MALIEKWKQSLDEKGYAGGILMDLSKAFDTINHQLLIAKLHAYGFDKSSLTLILSYLSNRWQRTKINLSFSSWSELLQGVPQGSVLGTFNEHVLTLCRKAGRKVTALRRLVKFMPFFKRRIMLNKFIESQFSYCPLIWMFHSRKLNHKINHIHERALRLVYNDYTSTFENVLLMDGSVSIHHRNIQKVATEMFKAKSNLSPELTQSIFQRNEVLNLRSDNTFLRPKVNTVYNGEGSLRSFGPIVWNNLLPNKYKSAENVEIFKNKIKLWIPENYPCRLCKDYETGIGFL